MIKIVLTTMPSAETANALAAQLVEEALAACINVVPSVQSIYRWDGKVERSSENLLIIKTSVPGLPKLKTRLLELHPYEVPELVTLDSAEVSEAYARWVQQSVGKA